MVISKEFSELLGFLCAEGCYIHSRSSYVYFDKKRNKFYKANNKLQKRIEFGNKNIILLKRFNYLLTKEFSYSPKIKLDRICICKRTIIDSILNETQLGHLKWNVPKSVICAEDEVIKSFIKGYFNGDGTLSNRIRFFSTNFCGLKEVSKLLTRLNLKHQINGPFLRPNRKKIYEIYIYQSERDKFISLIKPLK
jgi:intein/homing endonuclease